MILLKMYRVCINKMYISFSSKPSRGHDLDLRYIFLILIVVIHDGKVVIYNS